MTARLGDTTLREEELLDAPAGRWQRVSSAFLGPDAHTVARTAPRPAPDAERRPSFAAPVVDHPWAGHLLTVVYALSGFVGVLLVVASAPVWRNAAPSWRLTLPFIAHPPDSSLAAAVLFLGGIFGMWIGWVGLIGRAERMPGSPRQRLVLVVVVLALWSIPPLLGTPILSNDSYSYAAQGEMATRGLDPTAMGPYALHRGPFLNAVDPIWRDAAAPYGPVSVQLGAWSATVSGHDAALTVWLMRALAALGVSMTAAGVVLLSRRMQVPTASALAAGVAGPLVLLHMLGGSHNDALMMGLLTLGMAAFTASRRVLSVVLVTLAVAVKLPAFVALAFIGWNWVSGRAEANDDVAADAPSLDDRQVVPDLRSRITSMALVGTGSGVLLAALCAAVGIGYGWITALSATGSVTSTFSLSTKLGQTAADLGRLAGLGITDAAWISLFRMAGLAVAAGLCAWLLVRSPRIGVVRATGLAMVVSVALGPVLWPWYLPAGLALLAASGLGRWRPTFIVVVLAASVTVWPTSVDPVQSLLSVGHLLGLVAFAVIVAVAWAAQRLSVRRELQRIERMQRRELVLAAHQRWLA